MRVTLSYPEGPMWGHKIRCEILASALQARGHELVKDDADMMIWDHTLQSWEKFGDPLCSSQVGIFVVMGSPSLDMPNCWAWHPLGEPGPRTLTGKEYLILDPALAEFKNVTPEPGTTLITMGAADEDRYTEMLLGVCKRRSVTVVQGPNFGRDIVAKHRQAVVKDLSRYEFLALLAHNETVVCGWGTTAFEAVFLRSRVLPIVRNEKHDLETHKLFLWGYYILQMWSGMTWRKSFSANEIGLDLNGASRTVAWLEMLHEVYGENQ